MLDNSLRILKRTGFQALALIILLQAKVANAYDFNENSGLDTTANNSGYKETALNSVASIDATIANIITVILSLVGIVFLFLIMFAGIKWMFANGSEEQVTKSKHTIRDSIVGLIIVFGAYAIVWLVVSLVSEQSLIQ